MGAALLSAGAVVAATPALLVPNDEVQIAAPAAVERQTLTAEQYELLRVATSLVGAFLFGHGALVTGDGTGSCSADGAVCLEGFTGAAYYLVDQFIPDIDVRPGDGPPNNRPIDRVFFEEGFTGVAHDLTGAFADAIDNADPTGRLDLGDRVDDFFEGGITQLVGNLLLDNLPEDTFVYGITDAFFFGYGTPGLEDAGFVGVINYVVDAFRQGTPTPVPTIADAPEGATLLSEETDVESGQESGPTSTRMPSGSSLVSVSTPSLGAPLKRMAAPEEEPEAKADVEEENTVVDGGVSPVANPQPAAPTFPKFEVPKLPELKLPQRKVVEKEEAIVEDGTEPVDTKDGNKAEVEPVIPFGKPKSSEGGGNFLSNLNKAVKKALGGGADSGDTSSDGSASGNDE
ncbi:hypothetical protein [Mycolicibacterium wolinskyi]|uniref:hypothetical protein n=1 Tax=Mycolicibacterium wolinskyi TaxID=59750 RepID=UPI003BA96A78